MIIVISYGIAGIKKSISEFPVLKTRRISHVISVSQVFCPRAEYRAYKSLLPYLKVSCWPDPSHVRDGWSQQPQPTTAVSHCSNTSALSLLRGNEPISRRYSYCNIWLTESVTSKSFWHAYVLLYFQIKTPPFPTSTLSICNVVTPLQTMVQSCPSLHILPGK